jgi:uncharacterized protein
MHPVFGPAATVIAGILFGYALLVEPLWGRRVHRRLVRRRDEDPGVLLRTFRLTIAAQVTWSVLVLLAVAVATDLPARDLGFRWPRADPLAYGLVAAMAVSVGASFFVQRAIARRAAAGKGEPPAVPEAIAALLPRTTAERWHAAAVAVTAGVCEELLYRGFFVAAGTGPAHLPLVAAAVVALMVFTLAHIYQGARQLIAVTALAVVFTVLYLRSGSLLLPVIAHVLIDLQGLLVTRREP